MGDRTNPIKFGPEWLRNLSREPSNPGMQSGSGRDGVGTGPQGAPPTSTAPPPGSAPPPTGPPPAHRPVSSAHNTPKILLAKLRYGREEMLALYDSSTADAPSQLKVIDLLYQAKGKPPYALNTFEEDTRDNTNRMAQSGNQATGDRYPGASRGRSLTGMGESRGRGQVPGERGRARGYSRPLSVARGATSSWHSNTRNSYSGMADDDPNQPLRPWGSNNQPSSGLRPMTDQADWQNKQQQYRVKRTTSTNWRQQQNRDDGEEWRSTEPARRPQEKWGNEWEWPDNRRPNHEKWHSNRRTWVGGDSNEDSLPEWAMDNTDQCGGTFDSSGAFHGYSNDDTNLPKNQETSYPLTRSHTHGSFARSKGAEEGSEEWWASEKAKKLLPKRFDASEIKFKKQTATKPEEKPNTSGGQNSGANGHSTGAILKVRDQPTAREQSSDFKLARKHSSNDNNDSPENEDKKQLDNNTDKFDSRTESKENTNDDKGNFHSVILSANNILRQKHQNISVTPTETPKRQQSQGKMVHFFDQANQARQLERDEETQKEKDNKIVEDILQMNLEDGIPSATMTQLLTNHNSSLNSHAQLPSSSIQMRMTSPLEFGMNAQNKQNMQVPSAMQPEVQSRMMQPIGITNSMLNASLGLPLPNSSSGLPSNIPNLNPGLSNNSILGAGIQGIGNGNMAQSGLQVSGLPSGQGTMQGMSMSNLQGNRMQGDPLQSNLQPGALANNGMQAGNSVLTNFPSASGGMPGMNNSSLFNNIGIPNPNEIPNGQNMFPYQQPSAQPYNNSIYANMMNQQMAPMSNMGMQHNMSPDQWYYEDPNKTIQGPFTSKDMFNWFRAGFFSPTLMVRRACEAVMRPLGTYGPMPFGQMDLLPPFPLGGGFDLRPQQSHDNMINPQQGLGIDVSASDGFTFRPPFSRPSIMPFAAKDPINFDIQVSLNGFSNIRDLSTIPVPGPLPYPPYQLVQNNKVESLWGQPTNNVQGQDLMWMQAMNNNGRTDSHVNSLSVYFWENQFTVESANVDEALRSARALFFEQGLASRPSDVVRRKLQSMMAARIAYLAAQVKVLDEQLQ